ncbi:hypothetical protein ACFX1S_029063 [Malus domestica]
MPISYDKEKSQTSVIRVESLLLGTSTFVNVVLSAALCLGFGLAFSYEELQEATNGFTEELGKGVFGVVSKGDANWFWCRSGELNVISQTHHKNLVRLFGYCDKGQQRSLVF